jgi:hypothetical protein
MKSITRLSLALMIFSLFSISYLFTSVSAQPKEADDIIICFQKCLKANDIPTDDLDY